MQDEKKIEKKLSPDRIVDDKLSIVLERVETLLKPYQHTLQTRVLKVNNSPTEIELIAIIKL